MKLFEGQNEIKSNTCELSKLATERLSSSTIDIKKVDAPLAKEIKSADKDKNVSWGEKGTFPFNSEVTIAGEKVRSDDNGNIHQKYNPETKQWELIPNNEYTVNGYDYKTNKEGKIVNVSGVLQAKSHEGRPPIKDEIPNRRETDDRGHIIADMFNGSNKIDNIVPMNKDVNQRQYRAMEDYFRDEVQLGKKVEVGITIKYDDTGRPTKFIVNSIIDGEKQPKRVFLNESDNGGTIQ